MAASSGVLGKRPVVNLLPRPVEIEALDQELRLVITREDIALMLVDPGLPDAPVIGSLLDYQHFTGRTYPEDIGKNPRFLNYGCRNDPCDKTFLKLSSISQGHADMFAQLFPAGSQFVLENRRSVAMMKGRKMTFQNYLTVFPVRSEENRVLLCGIACDTTFASVDVLSSFVDDFRERLQSGDLASLCRRFVTCSSKHSSRNFARRLPPTLVPATVKFSEEQRIQLRKIIPQLLAVVEALDDMVLSEQVRPISISMLEVDGMPNMDAYTPCGDEKAVRMARSRASSTMAFCRHLESIVDRWAVWAAPQEDAVTLGIAGQVVDQMELTSTALAKQDMAESSGTTDIASRPESLEGSIWFLQDELSRKLRLIIDSWTSLPHFSGTNMICGQRNPNISVMLTCASYPDSPIIGTLYGFAEVSGRSENFSVGRNCRFLNKDCENDPETLGFLRKIQESPEASKQFMEEHPDGKLFILMNQRRARTSGDQIFFFNMLNIFGMTQKLDDREFPVLVGVQWVLMHGDDIEFVKNQTKVVQAMLSKENGVLFHPFREWMKASLSLYDKAIVAADYYPDVITVGEEIPSPRSTENSSMSSRDTIPQNSGELRAQVSNLVHRIQEAEAAAAKFAEKANELDHADARKLAQSKDLRELFHDVCAEFHADLAQTMAWHTVSKALRDAN
jgi:hypothetical protein